MRSVNQCVQLLDPLMDAVMAGNHARTGELAKEISALEHAADEVKNELRDHLPRSIFLPVAREDLLEILSTQDSISDAAEDVGMIVTMRKMEAQNDLRDLLDPLVQKTLESVSCYSQVIGEIDRLVDASFVGKEAQRVMDLIRQVSTLEHEADLAQEALSRRLFEIEDRLKPVRSSCGLKSFADWAVSPTRRKKRRIASACFSQRNVFYEPSLSFGSLRV